MALNDEHTNFEKAERKNAQDIHKLTQNLKHSFDKA